QRGKIQNQRGCAAGSMDDRASQGAKHFFSGYCCYFIGLIFAFQLLINLGVNTGTLPTKGLTLPFISYGGNSLIISSAMFGFVLRCAYPREVRGG
ncbi:MAG: FtsW/RodA/SpoVE family cell cycle protein, partial [Pseudomonadota bacterium]|nr:FtsW/RodA/SpoVE family cell cycle protein [Pseudomonadota bacterium]